MRFAFIFLCGCNTVFGLDETIGIKNDARSDCPAGRAFGPGTEVAIAASYSVEAARFNAPRSLAYLSLCDPTAPEIKNTCELFTAPLLATGEFGGYSKLGGINTPDVYDSYPTITPDGQHIVFGSGRQSSSVSLWVAIAQMGTFDNAIVQQLRLAPDEDDSNEPYVLSNGTTLYFGAADYSNGQRWDLYRASGAPPSFGGNGNARPLSGPISSTSDDMAPVVTDDELEVFFASDRAGSTGGLDVFTSVRFAKTDDFATPIPLGALSSAGNDWPVWISPDRCDLLHQPTEQHRDALRRAALIATDRSQPVDRSAARTDTSVHALPVGCARHARCLPRVHANVGSVSAVGDRVRRPRRRARVDHPN